MFLRWDNAIVPTIFRQLDGGSLYLPADSQEKFRPNQPVNNNVATAMIVVIIVTGMPIFA